MTTDSLAPFGYAPRERTLPILLQRQAERFGERRVLVTTEATWTFAQACTLAAGQARTLADVGIRSGERVAILSGNRAEVLRLVLACAWLGAIAVPINTACKGPQLQYYLANSGARLLAIEHDLLTALEQADLTGLPLERVWTIDAAPAFATLQGRPLERLPEPDDPLPAANVQPGQTLAILYTSGTTGPSKGVCSPHAQFFWWSVNTARLLGVREGDVLHTTLPLFHINALNTFGQALLCGATEVVERRFSASTYWSSLIARGATIGYLLGAMVPILLARAPTREEREHKMRIALGPGVPAEMHRELARRTGIVLLDGFGSTETNFVIGGPIAAQRAGFMGPVYQGFRARVVDADDDEVPPGVPGELILRAEEPFAFATGYFGMPERTVEAWRNLWFHTGDRVVCDAEGYFKFVDRLKDAIRRRGENISSYEVEQVLLGHPAIATAAVFPVQSELAEDEVMAAIVLRPGQTLTPQALIAYCEPRLPYFAVPRYVDVVAELPRTENGKIQKYRLRERGVTATTWDRGARGGRGSTV
jgi:crotonobetaine/carnitine-CoA ligase